jgi:hypothetical protein
VSKTDNYSGIVAIAIGLLTLFIAPFLLRSCR